MAYIVPHIASHFHRFKVNKLLNSPTNVLSSVHNMNICIIIFYIILIMNVWSWVWASLKLSETIFQYFAIVLRHHSLRMFRRNISHITSILIVNIHISVLNLSFASCHITRTRSSIIELAVSIISKDRVCQKKFLISVPRNIMSKLRIMN